MAALVKKYAPMYGIMVHSPVIAQAILESASGTSELALAAMNFHGLKYKPGRCPTSSGVYYKVGSEQNADGTYTSSAMQWFKFDNMEDAVIGYFDFINISRYANLKGVTDPLTYMQNIKADGYATSLKYVENVMAVIEKYNLTQYDPKPEKESVKPMRINIHAGHNPDGKVACGAIGFIKESTENRNVKNEVIRLLRALGHTVYDCTCDNGTSKNDVLQKIVAKCNEHTVDLDVSIHFNAGASDSTGNGATTGTEVFIYNDTTKAKPYAQGVARSIASLGFKLRDDAVKDDVKNASYLYVLKNTKAPAMLIECCFVDDKDDVALYDYKSMAEAIVYGITGQKYSEPVVEEKPVETGKKEQFYIAQAGKYREKSGAERKVAQLKAAGFDAIIVKA
jgi:N-acetylmuramoyl-L-alanine amidase